MSTRTTNRPDRDQILDQPTPPAPRPRLAPSGPARPAMDLSVTQVLGGSLAAATAAALGSRLGVVGTLTGAALVSVVASVAGAFYTASLRRTRDRMSRALGGVVGDQRPLTPPRPQVRLVLVGAVSVFALAAGGVTAVELLTGSSLSGRSGSTTVATTLHQPAADPQPAEGTPPTEQASPRASTSPSLSPGPTASASPSPLGAPVESTPSPTVTGTAGPSASPSSSPTPRPSEEPSDVASPSATPSEQTGRPLTP